METIFDKTARETLIARINTLTENSAAQWGKMNVYQMVKHCRTWEEWIQGKHDPVYRQEFIGKIFGKMGLKRMLNEKPFDKNVPTSKPFKIEEKTGDLNTEKHIWINLLHGYDEYSNPGFIHDFFGKMTREQIGILAYKHTDHHLRQFSA